MELGGNNAMIVDNSADINCVISSFVDGFFQATGQSCTSTRRLVSYIHIDITHTHITYHTLTLHIILHTRHISRSHITPDSSS